MWSANECLLFFVCLFCCVNLQLMLPNPFTIKTYPRQKQQSQVRRMLFNSGYPCEALKRIKFGSIELGDMETGVYRVLSDSEIKWAEELLRSEGGI